MGSEILENIESVKSEAYDRLLEKYGEECAQKQLKALGTIIELAERHMLPESRYFVTDKNENAGQPSLRDNKTLSWNDRDIKYILTIS